MAHHWDMVNGSQNNGGEPYTSDGTSGVDEELGLVLNSFPLRTVQWRARSRISIDVLVNKGIITQRMLEASDKTSNKSDGARILPWPADRPSASQSRYPTPQQHALRRAMQGQSDRCSVYLHIYHEVDFASSKPLGITCWLRKRIWTGL